MDAKTNYLRSLCAREDYDRYLISLCAPRRLQAALWALLAFNHEIAKTREVVTQTSLGQIRLLWWRDRIREMAAGAPPAPDPVLQGLAGVIGHYPVAVDDFEALIYAREFDLEGVLPGNAAGLGQYAVYTSVPLCRLMLSVWGQGEGSAVCDRIAAAYALAGLARAWPHHWRQGRCYFPRDWMKDAGLAESDLPNDCALDGDATRFVIRRFADEAGFLLAGPRPRSALMRGMAHVARHYIRRLERAGYSPLLLSRRPGPGLLPLTLPLYGAR